MASAPCRPRQVRGSAPPPASRLRRLRRSAKRRIASTRSSSVDELERVDAGAARSAARSSASRSLGRLRRSACGSRGRACRRSSCSPVSASCIDDQAEVGQLHLQRVEQPHGEHFVALRELRERLAPSPAALMKSETTKTSERRVIELAAPRAAGRARSVVPRLRCAPAAAASRCRRCSTWRRPLRAGITVSTLVAVEQRADAVAVARQQAREHARRTRRDTLRLRTLARAEVDRRADRSSRNQAVDLAVLV